MIRGLYTSAYGMLEESRRMDVISNNLANVNTTAFKKDSAVLESFPDILMTRINDVASKTNPSGRLGKMQPGSDVGEIFTYYTQGQLANTGGSLDMAFKNSDNAFFTVGVPGAEGEFIQYYTRDGAFTLNAYNELVTKEGYAVLGENGVITLSGEDFTVAEDGTVYQNGEVLDKLLIKSFSDTTTLRKLGSNLVETTDLTEEEPFSGMVMQGFIEQSNVNVIKEMVDMIAVTRAYEANQKVLQAQDGTLERAVNEVGAIR
ncbi:flagellar basal-body rod protein FlgG [Anaerobacterium chartisolvens]|uniref:Flagellar basal-body rod protein FlgG n=1 Tax=Anaerobacterium chartisolvens TaxID=1297424 RepID=A0A369AVY0_9FIRM|nr:flagellar hook-basal body protein [Anaerobacterium chartisolvens]RCX13233.1 flagellar basal-body rod protein FlgG [Anaerobacterium chartisolvens]